ncbi:MAG: hypothetical protein SFY70_07715 [Bacteroidia bacterium]|nr:hypothetical protein [Bacteroidia bacterium]
MEPLKYIYNAKGEKEAVIVPIEAWEDLVAHRLPKRSALSRTELRALQAKLAGVFPANYAQEVREEWERTVYLNISDAG